MVSHPLSIREALGPIPSVSSLVFLAASPQCLGGFTPAQYARGPGFNLQRVQFSVPGIVTPVHWWYHTRSACGRRWVQSPACTVWCFRHRRTRGVMVSHPLSMREPGIQSSACSWHRRPRGELILFSLSMLERPCSICCNPIESEAGAFNLVFSSGTWCSGITPAQHAEGPGFNPQRVPGIVGLVVECFYSCSACWSALVQSGAIRLNRKPACST